MATNRNNNRNTQNNRANNKRISSDNEEQLELIKINVDKVKKDVTEVSVHTRKEISAITKKVDELITKLEQSMKLSASQSSKQAAEMLKQQNIMVSTANKLLDVSNKTLENEKKTTQQKKEQVKQQENITDAWLADRQQSKDNTNMILDAIKGKGSFSNVMLSNNNKAKDDIINRMRTIESSTSLSAGKKRSMMNELTNQFNSLDKSAGKIQAAATIMDTSVKVVKIFLNTWMDRFNDGMNKIVNTYESTYSQQAVQTNMNQKEYFDKQREMQDSLNKQGLQNNVAISDVMQATSDFVSNGITNMSQAMQLGEQSAIAKTLAPYLDTQSEAFVSLNQSLGTKFSKSMIGMGSTVSDIVGQNRFTVKNLNSIIDMLNPIMLASEKDLLGEDELAYLESMKKEGYSEQAVLQMMHNVTQVKEDPIGSIQNGNLIQRILASKGEDYVANTDITDMLHDSQQEYLNIVGNATGYAKAAAIKAMGLESTQSWLRSREDEVNADEKSYNLANNARSSGSNYGKQLANFANDQYTTARDQKDILAESLALEYAIANEKWPDLMKAIKEIVPAIASMFATYVGGKLLGKVGGNLLGLGGKAAGKHAGSGIASTLAGSVGGTGTAATVAGGALTVAGVAGTAYGAYKTYEYGSQAMKSGKGSDWGATGAAAAGTAAIAGGTAFALLASNPVGWAVAAFGGIALAAADLIEDLGHDGDIMEDLNKTTEDRIKAFRESNHEETKQLQTLRDNVAKSNDLQEQQNLLLDAGIISKEDLQNAEYDNKKALIALTDQYIASKGALDNTGEALLRQIENEQNSKQNSISTQMWELSKKKVEDMTDEEKSAMGDFMTDYYYYMKKLADNGDKDAKYRIDEWEKYGNNLTDGIVSQDDLNAINSLNTTHYGDNDTTYNLYKKFMADENNVQSITRSGNVQKILGLDSSFNREDYSQAIRYINQAILTKDESSRNDLLSNAKSLGLTWDKLGSYSEGKQYQEKLKAIGINSYAVGSDYIHGDGLAYLHEGEAVLTSTAAALLRSQTTEPISMAHGVSSALAANSSISREQITSIVTAIQDQTAALIAKMEEIYTKILSSSYRPNYSSNMVGLKTN